MSITYKCNLCGETIDRDAPLVILNSDGERSANQWRSGWIGHYHADPAIGCWQRILEIIRAADGWAPRLDAIPTAVEESIAEARSKHRHCEPPGVGDEPQTDEDERTGDGKAKE